MIDLRAKLFKPLELLRNQDSLSRKVMVEHELFGIIMMLAVR